MSISSSNTLTNGNSDDKTVDEFELSFNECLNLSDTESINSVNSIQSKSSNKSSTSCKSSTSTSVSAVSSISTTSSKSAASSNSQTAKKRRTKKRSRVWKHFLESDNNTVTCVLCHEIIRNGGNTTNLSSHLRTKHLKEYNKIYTQGNNLINMLKRFYF